MMNFSTFRIFLILLDLFMIQVKPNTTTTQKVEQNISLKILIDIHVQVLVFVSKIWWVYFSEYYSI